MGKGAGTTRNSSAASPNGVGAQAMAVNGVGAQAMAVNGGGGVINLLFHY